MSRFCFVRERLVVAVSQRFDKNHLAVLCVTEPQWGMFHFKEKRPLHRSRLSCGFMEMRAK